MFWVSCLLLGYIFFINIPGQLYLTGGQQKRYPVEVIADLEKWRSHDTVPFIIFLLRRILKAEIFQYVWKGGVFLIIFTIRPLVQKLQRLLMILGMFWVACLLLGYIFFINIPGQTVGEIPCRSYSWFWKMTISWHSPCDFFFYTQMDLGGWELTGLT